MAQNDKGTLRYSPRISINRDVLRQESLIELTGYEPRKRRLPKCSGAACLSSCLSLLPIIEWLPEYRPKHDLLRDITSGITVAIMNIPQGIALSMLAGVSPATGLYMAIFPAIVYMFLGTSRHISIGTFAVASLMVLKVVNSHASQSEIDKSNPKNLHDSEIITPIDVGTSLALTVGLMLLLMALLRLGALAALLSDPLVSGFTTGAACHVATSQLKDVFGVSVARHQGAFKIMYTIYDVCMALPTANIATCIIAAVVMVFMIICNELVKPALKKLCPLPFPGELIVVAGGTIVSTVFHFNEVYNVIVIGVIPEGLPMPQLPRLDLVPEIAVDSIAITVVTYSTAISMGVTLAKKYTYEIRPNQELLALGISNLVGSCFRCIPIASSLSRSMIQEQVGGVTQFASLVSATILIIVLLWIGPHFEKLPKCVLAAIIIVALKPLFWQVKDLRKYAREGQLEMWTWIITFLAVVIIDVDIGLLVGILFSIFVLYINGLRTVSMLLGYAPDVPGIYLQFPQHANVKEWPDVKIFRYCGSLNFASRQSFKYKLYDLLQLHKATKKRTADKNQSENIRAIILDFSMITHLDIAGCRTLTEITNNLSKRNVRLLLASPVDEVYDILVRSMKLKEGPFDIFATLHDAVQYARALQLA